MKQSIIVDIIKSYFSKTPKRLVWFRNIMIAVACLISVLITLSNNGVIAPPEWIANLLSHEGIIAALCLAAGVQAAKKDINEGK